MRLRCSSHYKDNPLDQLALTTCFEDSQFVLSNLSKIKLPLNLGKIGMMGHSLGGATTIKLARKSENIKAAIDLDGLISLEIYKHETDIDPLDNGSDFNKPFLHIFASHPLCHHEAIHLKKDNFKAIIKGTEHKSFTMDYLILKDNITVFKARKWNLDTGHCDARSYQPEITRLIRSFFDKFLKNASLNLLKLKSDIVTIETARESF